MAKDMRQCAVAHPFTVVQASAADIPLIMSIERSPGYPALVGSYDANEHHRRMEASTCDYLLCRSAGEPVGFAVIRRDDDGMGTAQLHRIAVSPPGKGYGASFLQEICRWVFAKGDIQRLWLDLLPSNERADRLYRSTGFVTEGVMRSALRVAAGRQDLVLMSLLREDWQQWCFQAGGNTVASD